VINKYAEYCIPAATNIGRFGYTGQAWLPELGLYYYKARIYAPTLGRFMQTDPLRYGDGINWYDYVGGDPVNFVDPSGLKCIERDEDGGCVHWEATAPVGNQPGDGSIIITRGRVNGENGRGGGGGRPPRSPWQGRPDYCFTAGGQFGKALTDVGSTVKNAGLAGAAVGAITGVGAGGGLAIASDGATLETGGEFLRAVGGDPRAPARLLFGIAGGTAVRAAVPISLRNKLADKLSDIGFEGIADLVTGDDPCN
jgi:RHS repeat-associated protein